MNICEVWKDVVGYEGLYEVSNCGRVRRSLRLANTTRWTRLRPGQLLRLSISNTGYHYIGLIRRKQQKCYLVHRLVAMAFLGPPNPHATQVNHLDGNKLNNHISNLEFTTPLGNARHAIATGLVDVEYRAQRTSEANRKISYGDAEVIRKLLSWGVRQVDVAQMFGLAQTHISRIKRRESWQRAR